MRTLLSWPHMTLITSRRPQPPTIIPWAVRASTCAFSGDVFVFVINCVYIYIYIYIYSVYNKLKVYSVHISPDEGELASHVKLNLTSIWNTCANDLWRQTELNSKYQAVSGAVGYQTGKEILKKLSTRIRLFCYTLTRSFSVPLRDFKPLAWNVREYIVLAFCVPLCQAALSC